MKKILSDYIDYLKMPKWNKEFKSLRNKTIQNWYAKEYGESINYTELKEFEIFAKKNEFHYKTYFFYEKIEFDIYHYELIEKRNLELLKSLYKKNGGLLCNKKKVLKLTYLS